jgi:hypothetical protein
MSANVTTPVMVGIDNNGNYAALQIASPGGSATNAALTNVSGIEPSNNDMQFVNTVSAVTVSGVTDVTKLMVDPVKQFKQVLNKEYVNVLQTYYGTAVNDAIGEWTATYGMRYDDIKISVVANGAGPNNFHYYITIIRWF